MSANRSSNLLPIAGVMAAVSVFGGLLLVRGFQSFRPPATTPFLHESLGIESVNARLWQDPITAVEDHIKVAHNDPEAHGAEENTAIQKHLMVAKNDPEAHNATVETAIQEHIKAVHGDSEAHDADESKDVLKHVLMHVPVKEHEPPLHSIETLRKEIEETHHNNEGRLFILSVMVPGSHYAENREMRRRHRYAIISALGRKGLVPDNAEHIGYFLTNDTELSLSDHHSDGAKDHFSLAVPFEWFSFQDTKDAPDDPDDMTSNSQGDRALILWIDQQKIHDITTLASLLGKLLHFPKARRAISDPDRSIELSLIGPSNTAALLKLLIEEWKHNLPGAHGTHPGKVDSHQEKHAEFRKSIRENLYLYSSRTTASFENLKELKDFLLLEVDKWTVLYNRLVEYVFSRFGIKAPPPFNFEDGRLEFPRINPGLEMSRYNRARIVSYLTTGSMDQLFFPTHFIETSIPDEVLARDIAKELKLRRANLDDDQYIALIGEWDTYYGREFYRILADALKSESDLSDIEKLKLQNHILRFSYLRGMDGALSGQARTKQSDTSAAKRDQTSLNAFKVDADISIEQPFGPSQFDTMRRLASSIKEIAHGNKRIAAVGVIGSDLYDKQLVLQALRPSLPDAIFFTTDLDARLDHPSQYQWSRNLIIVSGHGLSLHKDLQQYIPPFRDAYQTSTFMATLLALGGVTYEHEEHGTVTLESDGHEMKIEAEGYSYEMNPHRYEVSRRGVIEFTPWKDNSANAVLYDSPGPWRFPISRIIWLYVLFTLAIILLSTMSKRLHRLVNMPTNSDEGPKRSVLMLILVALAVLAGFGGLIYYDHTSGSGEPFSLVAGVSIWPTEIIRVLTIIFCIRCLLLAEHENRRLDKKFEKKFGLVYVRGDGSLRKRVRKLLSVPNKSPNWIISIPHWFETVRSRLTVNFWG
ncbi:MAG: hypothetical protein O7G85_10620, partial [Planctomycetota bacterium]|nr:hypothetical protein [Planctomycetota bacterium]